MVKLIILDIILSIFDFKNRLALFKMDDDDYGAEFDQMVSETDKKVSTPANDANDNLEAPK